MQHRASLLVSLALPALLCLACSNPPPGQTEPPGPVARHSSSIAVTPDGAKLYVVNADADSVSEIDVATRKVDREIPLADGPPMVDA